MTSQGKQDFPPTTRWEAGFGPKNDNHSAQGNSRIYLFDSPAGPRYHDVSLNPESTIISKHDLVDLAYAYGELHGVERDDVNRVVEETIIKEPAHGESCLVRLDKKIRQKRYEIRKTSNNDQYTAMCNGVPVW